MINPMKLLHLKEGWEQFRARHPKFPGFLSSVSKNALTEGSVIEITVTTADGKCISSNLKLTRDDITLMQHLKEMIQA